MKTLCPKVMSHVLQAVSDLQRAQGTSRRRIVERVKRDFKFSKDNRSTEVVSQVERALQHCMKAGILRQEDGKYALSLQKPMRMSLLRSLDIIECRRRRRRSKGGGKKSRRRGGKRRRRRAVDKVAPLNGNASSPLTSSETNGGGELNKKLAKVSQDSQEEIIGVEKERKSRRPMRTAARSGNRRVQAEELIRHKDGRRATEEVAARTSLKRNRSSSRKGSRRNLVEENASSASPPPAKRIRSRSCRSRSSNRRNTEDVAAFDVNQSTSDHSPARDSPLLEETESPANGNAKSTSRCPSRIGYIN